LLLGLAGNDATLEPLKRFLIERTEGNPFFLEESVRSFVETQVLVGERGAYRLAKASPSVQVPATVQAILAARIDRLEPELKQILQTAAVVGKDVPFVLLQAVADSADEHLRHGLSRLQTGEFLYETSLFPDLEYTFKHALTHEVAYGSLVGDRRRALHARIVDAMVRLFPDRLVEQVERLAQHAVRAEMWEDAVAYLPEAAAKAVGRGANKEAVLYFDEALQAIGKLPESPACVERAIDLRLELRNTLLALVDLPRALDCVREAETCAVSLGDRERLARVLTHKTHSLWLVGEYEGAIDAGQEALTLASEIGDFSLTVAATQYLGQVYRTVGDYPQAIALFRRNVAATEGRRATERLGMHALPSVLSRGFLSDCLSLTGEFAEGAMQGRDAQRIAEAAGHPFSIVSAYGASVPLYVRKGDLDIAIPLLIRALDLCRVWNVGIWVPQITAALGLAYALAGRRDEALVLLDEAVQQISTRVFTGPTVADLSHAYLLTGNIEIAATFAGRALNADWIRKQPGSLAWLLHVLGDLATYPDRFDAKTGEAHYREALALAEPRGMRPLVAHCHFGLGKLYRRTDKRQEAQEQLVTATAMYRELEMRFWLEKVEAEMRELA
jgi:tetratricopeptide (TPR) repeat protein